MPNAQTQSAARLWTYALASLCLVAIYVLFELVTWPYGSSQLHTIMEVIATLFALFVGAVALVRYYAKPHNMILFIGAGFLGTALLDGYHAVVTSAFFDVVFPSAPRSLIPWSWNASRTFLALLMFASWLSWRREQKRGEAGRIDEAAVYLGVLVLTVISFCFFAFVPLGRAYFPDLIFGRPEEFLAAGLFVGALSGYLSKQEWRRDALEHWIIHSLIVAVFCQTIFMSRSYALFDGMFDMAHLLKIVSYCLVLIGLLCDVYLSWHDEQQLAIQRESLNRQLTELNQTLDRTVEERTVELENANQQLIREQYLLNTLVEGIPDPVFFKDRQGRFIRVNQAMVRHAGLTNQDELLGKTDADIWRGDLPSDTLEDERRILETGEPLINKEEQPTAADGKLLWVLVTKLALRDEAGEIVGTFGLAREITQRKRQEQEIERVNAELRKARDAAEQANRAKSDFLANMSHEIRTPMNSIIGMTELVLDTKLEATQRDYLTIVSESAESLLSIINQILDFSKIEAGKLELESVDFDVREQVGDTLKSLGLRAHAKQLELMWHVHSDVPGWLSGDPVRLRQMIVNLVGNAIKFTERGDVTVDVEHEENRDSHITLHCTVRDTGAGIPEDKRESIFSAFEQADSSTTRRFGGTGLGLAITARLAEAMGGRVWVESELGKGSTFHFTAEFARCSQPLGDDDAMPELTGLSVLVVDDHETNRDILREMLQRWGMCVETVEGGQPAIDALNRTLQQPRSLPLVISDVHMPVMDGFMLVEKLRSMEALRETSIILLTSGGHPGDLRRCEELGVVGHLIKPVKQSELLEAIKRVVGGRAPIKLIQPQVTQKAVAESLPALKILLAEDGKANQVLALGLLKKWGHDVVIAENGEEAVSRWRDGSFDLILMDVQMPVLDGLDATRRIREQERDSGRHIPIIAVTARAMKGDRERCLAAGMDEYVSKPMRKSELHRALISVHHD